MKAELQKRLAYKDKQHFKHVIVIPDEAITELGWKGGQELDLAITDGKLFVELRRNKPAESGDKT